ncbi:hypothetical protein [Actinomadura coerulea]|uniref:hypothetical protein n=1 Tax=Actinomadura coerulea TaxID=46159 RepID=UPI00341A1841
MTTCPDPSRRWKGAFDFSSMKTRLPVFVWAVAFALYQAQGRPENGADWTARAVPLSWHGTPSWRAATPAQSVWTARRRLRSRSRQTQPAASRPAAMISGTSMLAVRSDTIP